MLEIEVYGEEEFDEEKNEFIISEPFVLHLEHSLVSLSKWESIWETPFLDNKPKTDEQMFSYVECMVLDDNVPRDVLERLNVEDFKKINDYIGKKMTATWFAENKNTPKSRDIITSELIYYWMISFKIHKDFETWHLNRLLTLIQVCERKNSPPKKMNTQEQRRHYAEENARRRAALGTKG